MRFGRISLDDAAGAILAHSLQADGRRFSKGRCLSGEDIAFLRRAGLSSVTAACLDDNDTHEDDAAYRLAERLASPGIEARAPFTGRVNLHATRPGLFRVDRDIVDAVNRIDESLTLATIDNLSTVTAGTMVATVKIIPFATPTAVLERALGLCAGGAAMTLHAYRPLKATLVQTSLPATSLKMLDKTRRITAGRIESVNGELAAEHRCAHDTGELAELIAGLSGDDILLIAGASAIADRRDVLPAAIGRAGGRVHHFGMPVDPGNLLLLAELDGRPVLGLPGCARSPKLNGFDWVLRRIAAGLEVSRADIMGMGVGGLLAEIPTRPQPRASKTQTGGRVIAGIVLAAGQSRRMGVRNKLLIEVNGKPMVRHAVEAARDAGLAPVIVVTGHEHDRVEQALAGLDVTFVHNPDYALGLSTSLKAGLAALSVKPDGVLVALGDMPKVNAALVSRLRAALDPVENRSIIVPTFNGKRGNPVLWAGAMIPSMREVEGDVGAKHLIGLFEDVVFEVEMGDAAVLLDIDTPEALRALRGERP
ncbi:MAG: molybdopterin-binding/glycosyltransferase family 2 protein [Geminicoccaceae bacterium]